MMIPTELRCEYLIDPLGIDTAEPRLSWILQSQQRGAEQSGYQIIVAHSEEELEQDSGNLWNSGNTCSRETIHIVYDGELLKSGMRCFWKVRVWDKDGKMSDWSETAFWEMALLNDDDWTGEWLNDGKPIPEHDEDFYKDDPAPLFRKEFSVSKEIRRARLYITGLGYYEAHINGQRVGDHVLDPGWTDYSKRVLYSAYDVTDCLQNGENCMGVMLGNGWYNPLPLRMWGNRNLREHIPTGRPQFMAQLNINFADGSSQSISTDTSWKVSEGSILRNDVYLGEIYDARKEIPGWDQPHLDDTDWRQAHIAVEPVGQLQAQFQPPIKITATLKPVEITEPEPETYIFDFGQNFAGWVRMKLTGAAGDAVKLRYGELLNVDGMLNVMTSVCGQIKREGAGGPGSPEIAYQTDTYIAKGAEEEIYTPRFTFHGFRYVEVTGYPGRPTLDSLEGLRLNSAVDEVGSFECSNHMLNKIQEITRWTFLSNIFGVQSDCPHREKFGYGGDIAATSDAFMLNLDMANFYVKAARDWHDAALPDGMLTDTAPSVGIQYCGVAWALAHPLLLYQLYQYYGNSRLLKEQYQTASKWLDLVASQNPDHIIQEGLSDHEGLEEMPSPQMVTPLYCYSARLLSRLAGILGLEDDQKRYAALAQAIKDAYIQKFLEPGTGKADPGTQASQAFALYFDLVPPEEKQAVVDFLINKISDDNNGHLSTGIFGTKYLLHVLSDLGHTDIAYKIVNQKSFPGWGFMLENDATTLWEHWDFSDNTFSHNHPMFGSVSEWFYRWLAGIQPEPDADGFDKIIIKPQPVDGLNWVKAHYNSVRGRIASEWRCENGRFTLNVTIPPNTSATVFIPAQDASNITESDISADNAACVRFLAFDDGIASYEIGSGTYSFSHFTPPRGGRRDYDRANKLRDLTSDKVYKEKVEPHWFADNSRFWYRNALSGGHSEFVVVDAETGSREAAFDHSRLAHALSNAVGRKIWSNRLPFESIEFLVDENVVKFQAEGSIWHLNLETYLLTRIGEAEPEAEEEKSEEPKGEESPDGKWFAFFREHNLCVRCQETGEEFALSTDGNPENEYSGKLSWSPDSSKVVAIRTRQGDKHTVYLIESSPEDQLQPKLHSFDYLKPGDQIPLSKPQLFNVIEQERIPVSDELFPNPWSAKEVHWWPDSSGFTFLYNQRGHQVLRIIEVNAETGGAGVIIDEQSETFIDYNYKQFSHYLDETREIVWMSERDGWNHLYLYDSQVGQVKNQITSGEWVVRGVDHVDEEKRQIWFRAGGIHPEQDPYYIHYCRVNLDGTCLTILTEARGTHSAEYSPDRRFFVDTWSRVDSPPVTELRSAEDGSLICELERADYSELLTIGWKAQERFVAKGRDDQTDIYGLIYRPTSFDPDYKYPVIEQIYAGPHGSHVPKSFQAFCRPQETAELGFIVVQIDGMGTSDRSKKFHDVCWKNLGDSGFPDRILWIKAAAEKHPYMDISRVGIYGGSAGGQSSTRALLAHSDFYTVAVSDCGCHDNRMDKIWWNELWMGWPIGSHYDDHSNAMQAHRLQGKLMLIVGELDRNVDPTSTMQMVNALIKADKDFDMLVVPGGGHGIAESQYGNRRRQDFLVRHLLGVEPRNQP